MQHEKYNMLSWILLLMVGCSSGATRSPEDPSWSEDPNQKKFENVNPAKRFNPPIPSGEQAPNLPFQDRILPFGVRPALRIATPIPSICDCIAVEAGHPSSSQFIWNTGTPESKTDDFAFAIESLEKPCQNPLNQLDRYSIQGVEQVGADTVVTLEGSSTKSPYVHGAIVPKPGLGGKVLVKWKRQNKSNDLKSKENSEYSCEAWQSLSQTR